MTRLTDLSNELLELILSHLHDSVTFNTDEGDMIQQRESTNAAFRSLALTCRSLVQIATEHLYRTISFRVFYGSPEVDLFCRTLREVDQEKSSQLKSYVRVAVFWRYWNDDWTLTPKYAELINALSNVRELQLRTCICNMHSNIAKLDFLDPTSFPRLQRLYLNCTVSVDEVTRFVSSTPVETLRVNHVEERWRYPQRPSERQSLLQTLQIDHELSGSLMDQLLASIGGCKRLITWTRDTPTGYMSPVQELSRREFVDSLNPAKEVLEELELRYNNLIEWNRGDMSGMNLRDFSTLKTLKVNSRCLFTERFVEEKWDISGWLPRSLEHLEVCPNFTFRG